MANNNINLVSLDFDGIKTNLKQYLKAKPEFSDYDFDGSNMSVLLDVLSYNTYMNAFYLNMIGSEMFLDSAQLRNSVVSKAKELNYTPHSYRSSTAKINLTFSPNNVSLQTFTIPTGTRFTGKNANGTFSFVSTQAEVLYPVNGVFQANNFVVREGINLNESFIYDYSIENQRFLLNNTTIDIDSITVTVVENNGQTSTLFLKADNLYGLTANSEVFFIQGAEDGKYEILFGDGISGRKPASGAAIVVQYRSCSGTNADGSTNFVIDTNLGPYNGIGDLKTPTITVSQYGYGASNAESIEAIRFNAPRHYQTQNRAITVSDFETLVLQNYPEIKAVHVFGGEEISSTVEYGKVFISPATYSGYPLSTVVKQDIVAFLRDKCAMSIRPFLVDPDYLYLDVTTTVSYDPAKTTKSAADIGSVVSYAIKQFNTNNLTSFNTTFKFSRFEAAINDSDISISSNQSNVIMRKEVKVEVNTDSYIDVSFRNEVSPGTVSSSKFMIGANKYQYTDFNPNNNTLTVSPGPGNQSLITNSSNIVYLKDVTNPGYETYVPAGTIDYTSGTLALNKINITSLLDLDGVVFYTVPKNQDITAKGNDLIQIAMETLSVTVKAI